MEQKSLSHEDHKVLKDSQLNLQQQKMLTRAIEAEHENLVLKLYIKYELKQTASIDLETGVISNPDLAKESEKESK